MKFHKDGSRPLFGHIFVFGSNLAAIHVAGAALAAKMYYGASYDVPSGPCNHSYAIPTKDMEFECLSLDKINQFVIHFVNYTQLHPTKQFFVTRVGCGLAGNRDEDIAPMFRGCGDNCSFAEEWREYLEDKPVENRLY